MSFMDMFWAGIDEIFERIEFEKPDTFDKLRDILHPEGTRPKDMAFFAGSGGDKSLWWALVDVGWQNVWFEEEYYYALKHPATGEVLTYVEGDIYRGDQRP
jgi:hypothetical protein